MNLLKMFKNLSDEDKKEFVDLIKKRDTNCSYNQYL